MNVLDRKISQKTANVLNILFSDTQISFPVEHKYQL